MKTIARHLTRSFLAGIVTLLPIGGTLFTVWWIEDTISKAWLARQPWYVPGLGLGAVVVIIYVIGLFVSSFVGRWIWKQIDQLLDDFPLVGALYRTLKQVLGYGEGEEALFERAVLVPSRETDAWELGLVTQRLTGEHAGHAVVFVPGSPNPTTGRLLVMDETLLKATDMSVNDALTALVAVGKTELRGQAPAT